MRFLLLGVFIFLTSVLTAQDQPFNPKKKFHPDSLQRWTKSIMSGISEKHPGFYRYTPKARFDHLIDSTVLTIQDSLTELEYYRKLKPLFAQIGCLHTGITLSKEYEAYLNNSSTLIPIEIFIDERKRVLITKTYDKDQSIQIGCEVVSINSRPISDILNILLNAIPADGFNQTEKILLLNHRFSFWYQSIMEVAQAFEIQVKMNEVTKTYTLRGVTKDVFPTLESLESNFKKPLEFEVTNGIGILKVHSFAKSTHKKYDQDFKHFIKATFEQIQREGIQNLIVDLRYNTGGTDGNAVYLARHFFDSPFRYWDRIEVTEAIAKEIKGLNRLFYKKPKQVNDSYHWKKIWMTTEFDYYEPQKPAKRNFIGKTYLLTNGLCMSSCSDFVAVLAHNRKALVVGQETGGGFQGNTSGMMPTAKIPTGLMVTIPLMKYTNAVDPSRNWGHGTTPDYELPLTFTNWVEKKDVELEFVLNLIQGK